MAEKKSFTAKEIVSKIKDLKIELLKNPTKRGSIKREIARLLTMRSRENRELADRHTPGAEGVKIENRKTEKTLTKLDGGNK